MSVTLLWGDQPYLLREAALELLGDVRAEPVDGRDWRPGVMADLATPSLFGEPRALLLTNAQDLPAEALDEIAGYAAAPDPDAKLVLTFAAATRTRTPPKKLLNALGDKADVRKLTVERRDLPGWLVDRARKRGLPATPAGANSLVQVLGEDLAELDRAIEQLASAAPGEGLVPRAVEAQFRGFGERKTWELCDAAFAGNLPSAARTLAGMLHAGEEPIVILGGIASRLRDLIRVRSLPPRTPHADVARAAGLRFDWQARRYLEQARRYEPADLARIHRELVEADRLLKQGGAGDVVLPTLVSRIAGAA